MPVTVARKTELIKKIVENPHLINARQRLHEWPEHCIQTIANQLAIDSPELCPGAHPDQAEEPTYKDKFRAFLTEVAESVGYTVSSWDDNPKAAHPELTAADRDKKVPRHRFPEQEGTVVEGVANATGAAT